MTGRAPRRYVNSSLLDRLIDQLSDRDWFVMESLAVARVLTGTHLTRLHFYDLSPLTRDRTRRLVLSRLTNWGILTTHSRRIGGVRGGSAGSIFSLDSAGQRLVTLRWPECFAAHGRTRHPSTPGDLFLAHALAVSELYVSLIEASRLSSVTVKMFVTEPYSWWPNGMSGWLKPDAYMQLTSQTVTVHYWAEVDRETESMPTLRRKLSAYLDFVQRGQLGPKGVIPRVAISVPSDARLQKLQQLIESLPSPAQDLFTNSLAADAAATLIQASEKPP